tara:strand:+ start:628 stop:861 length:234 start_codon:yes stop_codon:yes gene_type:complete
MQNEQNITPADFGKLVYNALERGDWIYCASNEVQEEIRDGKCSLLLDYFAHIEEGKASVEEATQWYTSDFQDAYDYR